jgi:hypothetical protein
MNPGRGSRVVDGVSKRFSRAVLASVLVGAVSAGCGGPDSPATDTADPSPSNAEIPGVTELIATGQPLRAGEYTRTGFEPAITIQLDGSWQAVQLADGFFDVQQDPGSPNVIAVQFARPTAIFGQTGTSDLPTTALDAVETLRTNPGLEVLESSSSRIGGLDGSQVTVENAGTTHAQVMRVPAGALGIDPGRRLWIAFFDTGDGLLAIMVGGSVARWTEALAAAEPLLESVHIGP